MAVLEPKTLTEGQLMGGPSAESQTPRNTAEAMQAMATGANSR